MLVALETGPTALNRELRTEGRGMADLKVNAQPAAADLTRVERIGELTAREASAPADRERQARTLTFGDWG